MYESTKKATYKPDLLYPNLSYKIVGVLFDVFTGLGYGHREKEYHKAIKIGFENANIGYQHELPIKIFYKERFLTTLYLDFLVENKIVLEIKQGNAFNRKDIDQVYDYLKSAHLQLGILARITKNGIRFKRIINIK